MQSQVIKILFLIDVLFWGGGTENHLAQLVTRLDPKKFSCTVYVLHHMDETAPSVQTIQAGGVECRSLRIKRAYTPIGFLHALRLAYTIRKERFDIVQTFHFVSDTYGVMVARLSGVRNIVSSRRDMDTHNNGFRRLARRASGPFVTHFIAVCNAVARNFSRKEHVGLERIRTIYNGVDLNSHPEHKPSRLLDLRAALGISEDAFVIGNVAVFRPDKDYELFFAAIRLLVPKIPGLRVIAVGPGPLLTHFQQECAKDDVLRPVVVFTGGVTNVSDHISIMDVACLCPSRNEGLSNAILEEMALSKPVVATDVGGNAELVVHGQTGSIVPAGDVQKLTDALLSLYRFPEQRIQMGRQARQRVEALFGLEQMIHTMEDFYQRIH